MSFSGEVKRELAAKTNGARHCLLAELAAIVSCAGHICAADGSIRLKLDTSNPMLLKKFCAIVSLLSKAEDNALELVGEDACRVLESLKMWDGQSGRFLCMEAVDGILIQQSCCKRAFIRGAFLASGSMSNPDKAYHFEIVCRSKRLAEQLLHVIHSFEVDARIVPRKKSQVVYIKEGEDIVNILNVMEAHHALMSLENVRIVKEMRNSINRQVNCETANISKMVNASVRQMEDIRLIQEKKGLESLPEHLREIALLRLSNPDVPLKELGGHLNPPIGKSGANHRLRRISELAEKIRAEQ